MAKKQFRRNHGDEKRVKLHGDEKFTIKLSKRLNLNSGNRKISNLKCGLISCHFLLIAIFYILIDTKMS